jgi:hypothetical protein
MELEFRREMCKRRGRADSSLAIVREIDKAEDDNGTESAGKNICDVADRVSGTHTWNSTFWVYANGSGGWVCRGADEESGCMALKLIWVCK